MATVAIDSNIYTLQIPSADKSFFMALVKKMGWTAKRQKQSNTSELLTRLDAVRKEIKDGQCVVCNSQEELDSFFDSL